MSCISNIDRFLISNEIINNLTVIYRYIGKNDSFRKSVDIDLDRIVSQTVERDCYFLAKILKLDLTDNRMRLIITKDSNPRSLDEKTLYNLKEVLSSYQKFSEETTLDSSSLINTINFLFPTKTIKYDYERHDKFSSSVTSKRIVVDDEYRLLNDHLIKNDIERIYLYLHYFIDLCNIEPFTVDNEVINYLSLLLILRKCEIDAFKYISLYEIIYNNLNAYKQVLNDASFNWKEGYPKTLPFIKFMTDLVIDAYKKAEKVIKEYITDKSLHKGDNIENTISNLPRTFTKEDIRAYHPYVSESTINRALAKLKDENNIKPLGKGRSAKWIKTGML